MVGNEAGVGVWPWQDVPGRRTVMSVHREQQETPNSQTHSFHDEELIRWTHKLPVISKGKETGRLGGESRSNIISLVIQVYN